MTAESLASHLRELDAGNLRAVVRYEGDDYETLHEHETLGEEYPEGEFESLVRQLVLKGFDDPVEQPTFAPFGHLDATVRWFHRVVVIQVPLDDWSGVIAAFDRTTISDSGQLVDAILEYVEENLPERGDPDAVLDEFADEFAD